MRRLALDLGVELRFVRGTGPAGRILKEDLLAWQGRQDGALTAGATAIALPDAYTAFEDFTGAKIILDSLGDMTAKELLELVSRR